jgi:Ca2+-binding RTX toxin-like protein
MTENTRSFGWSWLRSGMRHALAARSGRTARTDRRALVVEQLEDRAVPTSFLTLSGTQAILPNGANINVSLQGDPTAAGSNNQREIVADVNPTNPLHVVAVSESIANPLSSIGTDNDIRVYESFDGGVTWTSTLIDGAIDGLSGFGIFRRDPTVAFDANGNLYVAYARVDSFGFNPTCFGIFGCTDLIALSRPAGMAGFPNVVVVDSAENVDDADDPNLFFPDVNTFRLPGIQRPRLATGLDPSTGGQAAYIAYTINDDDNPDPNTIELTQFIFVAGTNDVGTTYPAGVITFLNDDVVREFTGGAVANPMRYFAEPAVGPQGQLYVVWHEAIDSEILFDRDLDGLFGTTAPFGTDVLVTTLTTNLTGQVVPAHTTRGVRTAPVIDVDVNNPDPAIRGRLYVAFVDTMGLPSTSIMLATSPGLAPGLPGTWTVSTVDASGTAFNPWLDVDQFSGSVNVGYYTTVGDPVGNNDVSFRVATNISQGAGPWFFGTLTNPPQATSNADTFGTTTTLLGDDRRLQFGDIIGLVVHMGTIHGFWSDNRIDPFGGNPPADIELFYSRGSYDSSTNGNVLTTNTTIGNDTILALLNPINTQYLDIRVNAPAPPPIGPDGWLGLLASVDTIIVNGLAGDDMMTVEFGNGNPLPINSLTFHGGTAASGDGFDTLTFLDSAGLFTFTNVIYEALGTAPAHAGNVNFDGLVVAYTGLSPIFDFTNALNRTFLSNVPGGQRIRLLDTADLMGFPMNLIDSDGTNAFEPVTFRNPVNSLTINAGPGNDVVLLLSVDPTFTAQITVQGGDGDDLLDASVFLHPAGLGVVLDGGSGNDTLLDGLANDTLLGGAGNDSMVATVGNDSLAGGDGDDTMFGGVGSDTMDGGAGNDVIFGEADSDSLLGGAGNDTIFGGAGNDTINGNTGDDLLVGSIGDDRYVFDNAFDMDFIEELAGEGIDTIDASSITDNVTFLIFCDAEAPASAQHVSSFPIDFIERLIGGANEDFFVFGDQAELAFGTGTIDGGPNSDTLDYSRYLDPVTVNLIAGIATGTGGIFNIENVIGSPGRPNNIVFLDGSVAPGGTLTANRRRTSGGGSIFDPSLIP